MNLINHSILESISKCIQEIRERVPSFTTEKDDTYLKQFWSNDNRITDLSFTSIKQETEDFIFRNNKLRSDLPQKRKDLKSTNLENVNGY